ncbi:hypothetical protein UPYG_G00245100 [Umbra pygmaea]|uniref:Septin-type G domain-containing protein n=1 Tax=Umbra pygmaea TaxID=75934 RepID=A0ABD0WG48_UMBPY
MATCEKETSPKLKDIISKSLLMKSGPPNRYQLVPKKQSLDGRKEEESKLRRWTIGERNHSKDNKTVLLVGERGAGKSTLINTMVNYVMGVELEDEIWFEVIEEDKRSIPRSWTSVVIVYDIFGFEDLKLPYSLTIVDTPGYGDPKWNKEDKEVTEKLHSLLRSKDGIDQIDVVGLVMEATENSLSEKQKYIFGEVASLFDKTMKNNIVALLTHSDAGSATNALRALKTADIRCARDEKNQPVHFLFNIGHTVTTTSKLDMSSLRNALNTMEGMDAFLEFVGGVTPEKLKRKKVPTEDEELEAVLQEKDRFASVPTSFRSD